MLPSVFSSDDLLLWSDFWYVCNTSVTLIVWLLGLSGYGADAPPHIGTTHVGPHWANGADPTTSNYQPLPYPWLLEFHWFLSRSRVGFYPTSEEVQIPYATQLLLEIVISLIRIPRNKVTMGLRATQTFQCIFCSLARKRVYVIEKKDRPALKKGHVLY